MKKLHDAKRFYKRISDVVRNRIAKKKLENLSREEESHEKRLLKFQPEDKFNVNPEFNVVEEKTEKHHADLLRREYEILEI